MFRSGSSPGPPAINHRRFVNITVGI